MHLDKNQPTIPALGQLALLVLSMALFSLLAQGLVYLLGQYMGLSVQELLPTFGKNSVYEERQFLRFANLITHTFTFTLAALFWSRLVYGRQWLDFLKLKRGPKPDLAIAGILFLMAILAFSQWAIWLNGLLPMPDWAAEMEQAAKRMVAGLLHMESTGELLFTLLVIGVVPGIGEELLFRGIIQQKMASYSGRPQLAVWMTALLFSVFHLQFAGLLPRFFLGVGLGYLLYWTKNMWMPILAHLSINGSQVLAAHYMGTPVESETSTPNWWSVLFAAVLLILLGYFLHHRSVQSDE